VQAFTIASLAPLQEPGPCRRYCDGEQGPKKQSKARNGSEKKSLDKDGLQPIRSAISSL